jgi:hypothetical protein
MKEDQIQQDNSSLEDALIDLGVAALAYENPGMAATDHDDSFLRRKALELLATNSALIRKALCKDKQVRSGVKAGTTIAIAVAIMATGDFGKHFPAQATANALVIFGLEKFCTGSLPE